MSIMSKRYPFVSMIGVGMYIIGILIGVAFVLVIGILK